MFETEDDALAAANELASGKDLTQDFFVSEGEHQGDVLAINDIPIQFGDWKQYRERIVTISFV